jgi:hypothetical protein
MLAHVEPSSATAIALLVVCLVLVFAFEATNEFHGADAVATFWNIATGWFGVPNSSSHCIIGALGGLAPATFMSWLGSIALSALRSLL